MTKPSASAVEAFVRQMLEEHIEAANDLGAHLRCDCTEPDCSTTTRLETMAAACAELNIERPTQGWPWSSDFVPTDVLPAMTWVALVPGITVEDMGMLPAMLHVTDPRPAAEQFNETYAHGGGWKPTGAGKWSLNRDTMLLSYPGDPAMPPLAMTTLRDEQVYFYPYSFVMVLQQSGEFEVSRMD